MARIVQKIVGITPAERCDIRNAVYACLRFWPNDGGDETPREHIRSAFKRIRGSFMMTSDMRRTASDLLASTYAYEDM